MTEKEKPIYTVTTIDESYAKTPLDWKIRCVGFVYELEAAKTMIKENCCDIYEAGYYPYVVIEEVHPGFYDTDRKELWFKWNENLNGFKECEKPKTLIKTCCFSIG